MKITRSHLKRIIKEEKAKLLSEMRPPFRGGYQQEEAGSRMVPIGLDEIDSLVQEMFAAYNNISARVDDAEDMLPEHQLARVNELLNILEKLSEDIDRGIK